MHLSDARANSAKMTDDSCNINKNSESLCKQEGADRANRRAFRARPYDFSGRLESE